LLEVRRASKSFGGLKALKGVSFKVRKGDVSAVIGPNGAGKTTLLNIISGIYPPDEGEVIFLDERITRLTPSKIARRGISRTFQHVEIFGDMTVLENVMVSTFMRSSSLKESREMSWEILERVRLKDKGNSLVLNVTLEDRKRLELARALGTRPHLLLLDEVMAGLTPSEINEAIELIRSLRTGELTIIVVEHIMAVILSLCDRIAVLDYGEKIAEDVPDKVVNNPNVIKAYLGERYSARN